MRGWGVTFLITAAGCVVLAGIDLTLVWILLAVVSLAGAVAGARAYVDTRDQIQRADTGKTLTWFGQMRDLDADVEAEWNALMDATTPRPLGAKPLIVDPDRLRSLNRIPSQRGPGRAS